MRKQVVIVLLSCLTAMPWVRLQADQIAGGQSTEGKDFWVTFMQADQRTSSSGDWDGNYNKLKLSLSISSRENCEVTVSNPFTGYSETVSVEAGVMKPVELYVGHPLVNEARAAMKESKKVCYAVNNEVVDTCALHVTSTANISLFATNYKKATFDATNVLPTTALLDEYYIQTYTPSDHQGTAQGSHFAVIAVEDNTKVYYTPSVLTPKNKGYNDYLEMSKREWESNPWTSDEQKAAYEAQLAALEAVWGDFVIGEHTDSVTLNKGEVYYVWTEAGTGEDFDLSGTHVKADKKIAVFQGCPHTNIPLGVKERDHIFSQAMPIQYWGTTFVLTASEKRKVDFIRILALNDGTDVFINGTKVHTFDFSTEKKQYWEFKIGTSGDYAKDGSCVLTTSCPCATHLFMASKKADDVSDGDPAMLWVNPIEQQIDQVTFATYASSNGTTAHYVNIVTDKPEFMTLDGQPFAEGEFKAVTGSDGAYFYARKSLGNTATSHTLKSDSSQFIAHVYGFTSNESYGYSAGGATRILTDIEIDGQEYTPDMQLCGDSIIHFACNINTSVDKIVWDFGDGTPQLEGQEKEVTHYYEKSGDYLAYVLIFRSDDKGCGVIKGRDSISLKVHIERADFEMERVEVPCVEAGEKKRCFIYYTNAGGVNMFGGNVTIEFDETAQQAHFDASTLEVHEDHFVFDVPDDVDIELLYGLMIHIQSICGLKSDTLQFRMPFSSDVIDQRSNNVLGLLTAPFIGRTVDDIQWYRSSDNTALEGQTSAVLNFYDLPADKIDDDTYYVCFTLNKGQASEVQTCACPKAFTGTTPKPDFEGQDLTITAIFNVLAGGKVFVNSDWKGETDIECTARWINTSGQVYKDWKFSIPNGGCTIPAPDEKGLYLLQVVTDKTSRSFKFLIN